MKRCPNCNARLDDESLSCHSCGTDLSGRPQAGGQPPSGGKPGQQPPGQGGQDQQSGPLSRRQLFVAIGGTAALVAGWFIFLGDPTEETPTDALREYFEAVERGDRDSVSTLVHRNSPMRSELVQVSQAETSDETDVSITVEETTEVSRENGATQESVAEFVVLEATITTSYDGSESSTETGRFRLAKNPGGTWKLWDVPTTTSDQVASRPVASFDFGFTSESAGPGAGVLTITHEAGDSIRAGALFVRGDGVSTPGNSPTDGFSLRFDRISPDLNQGSMVSAGTSIQLEADRDYDVDVVREDSQTGDAAVLGADSGPDA